MNGGGEAPWVRAFVFVLAGAGIVAGLCVASVFVAALLACGQAPVWPSMWSGLGFLIHADGSSLELPEACHGAAAGWGRGLIVGTLVLIGAGTLVGFLLWGSWKQSDAYFVKQLRARDGLARGREVRITFGAKTRLKSAVTVRPTLENPRPEDVAIHIGLGHGRSVYLSVEDSVVVEGSPRSGKGFRLLIGVIIDWPGPLITTSTRNDNLAATMKRRAKLGTVTVFDPQGLSGIANSMKINPIRGCDDALVARQRAAALIGGTELGMSSSNSEWAQEAEVLLSRLLMACALGKKDVNTLRDWGASPDLARPAVKILENQGPPGWASALKTVLDGDSKLLGSRWMGVAAATAPLQLPSVAAAMCPTGDDDAFDVQAFLSGQNTLYLIGTRSGAGAAGGFLGALLDDVVEQARRKALTSPGSRLDPPLGLVLDEIANMFSWKALPTVLSDGGGIGIWTLVVLQGFSQARTAWSADEADTIWTSAIAKILYGGGSDESHLKGLESILGTREVRTKSRSVSLQGNSTQLGIERLPVLSVDELHRIPTGYGVLAYKNKRGVLLEMPGWTKRADADEISAGKKQTEAEQADEFRRQGRLMPQPLQLEVS
ncbi:type IV secretory system conjugative DNA transfer family protein [Pseudoclavibacter sp. AY1H1]|uniref:type IV secretory system conjugative DNA transfer family protein n=1 Tax=Pseudoclavibacter sp. AY1H1 TaxID=2080584 RepID=UPI000CE819C0|nr:TraM recognition domain-containing protein [Pseudoclavibacter sp. AY1H1]PPF38542.1 hypothetical protein C5E05_05950 [Pseudoclavibacter sp. AY1H1]